VASALLPYFIPFGVALAVGGALRLALGSERNSRAGAIAILIGFAAAWHWLLPLPWVPVDAASRIVHIAIGGFLLGLVLSLVQPGLKVQIACAAVFAIGSIWATLTGALLGAPPDEAGGWIRLVLYALVWGAVFKRMYTLQPEGPSLLAIAFMLALGLGLAGQMSGDGQTAAAAYCLAAAVLGYLLLAWVLALPLGLTAVFGIGGSLLAVLMALAAPGAPTSPIALALLLLVPLADGTAKRLPLGPAALRPATYPLALMGVALLPIAIAATVAFLSAAR
jgi:hypothetical protein